MSPAFAFAALGVFAALLFGAAALWAVTGRGNVVSRIAPSALLLAALAPTGAYELIAVFGAQIAVIVGWVLFVRLFRAYRSASDRGETARGASTFALREVVRDNARFRLRELMQFVVLTALALAILRFAAPVVSATGGAVNWGSWILVGLLFGAAVVAAEWLVFGNGRWYTRVAAVALGSAAFGGLLQYFQGINFLIGLALCFGFAIALVLVRAAGWAWWRKAPFTGTAALETSERPARPWWRRPSQAALAVAAITGLALVVMAYWVMLPIPPPTIELPNPNGYEEVLQVARAMNWSAIPSQDWDTASVGACRQFVIDNAVSMSKLRDALQKDSKVPFAWDGNFVAKSLPDIQFQREVARAVAAEARLAALEGRAGDAADSYITMLRLGNSAGNGLMMNDLVGMAIGGMGLQGAASILPQLDAAELARLRREMDCAAAEHDSAAEVLERERVFTQCSGGWPYRIWLWVQGTSIEPALTAFVSTRERYDALLKLILAEAAVRQYLLERGEPPESLEVLVPEYLARVPADPNGDGPLKYRRTDNGYLLYSVGINGRDDGGVRATATPGTPGAGTDLFFDAPER